MLHPCFFLCGSEGREWSPRSGIRWGRGYQIPLGASLETEGKFIPFKKPPLLHCSSPRPGTSADLVWSFLPLQSSPALRWPSCFLGTLVIHSLIPHYCELPVHWNSELHLILRKALSQLCCSSARLSDLDTEMNSDARSSATFIEWKVRAGNNNSQSGLKRLTE